MVVLFLCLVVCEIRAWMMSVQTFGDKRYSYNIDIEPDLAASRVMLDYRVAGTASGYKMLQLHLSHLF